jgi:type I restriction-modification system DNA methylase subunit
MSHVEIDTNFQTPLWAVKYMISLVPAGVHSVLEPTPGLGNIVRELENQYQVTAPSDFWDVSDRFDAIVMNPPFTPMKMGYEILYKCMEMSDNIIALMPWLVMINSEKRTKDIMNFGLKSITHLPRKTFAGARVQCCVLAMSKGWNGITKFKTIEVPG